ncbi:MAG TPA: class I SAM-dependent methyltransferase [Polyangia bacterium]
MFLGARRLQRDWQVGDGREEAAAQAVLTRAPRGDLDAAIATLDRFASSEKLLINIGDEKGALLDQAVHRASPRRALELGAYVGYSALRIARALPAGGHLFSLELIPANAEIARRIATHAGAADRITFIVGSLGDGGRTLASLRDTHGFTAGSLDFVFIDHAKDQYLPDLLRILEAGWLHPESVVVADNIRFPGAPAYRRYMDAEEGKRWRTVRHKAHAEYQGRVRDEVWESTLI